MNDELQRQLALMLAKLTDAAGSASGWAAQQIPPLVHEKIVFGRVDETVQLLLAVGLCGVLVLLARGCLRALQDADDEIGWAFSLIALSIGVVFTAVWAATQVHMVLMVWFAPRLYVVEWLKGMVGK